MNVNTSRPRRRFALVVASLAAVLLLQQAALAQVVERGKFRLHKYQQPVGEETYEVRRDGDSLVLEAKFEFTDRSVRVPLRATLRTRQDLTPQRFEVKGKNSRFSELDVSVEVEGARATVREGGETRQVSLPAPPFFTASGYAPVSVQMMLVRYWASRPGRPSATLNTLPGGLVTIEHRGRDTVTVGGRRVELERYSIGGLIWGREILWFDKDNNLVAASTNDAEFDRFEAVREGFEEALPVFVTRSAEDGMAALASLARGFSRESKGALAVTGATLIDGTGRAPVSDSVVVVEAGRIVAAGPRAQVKIPAGAELLDARGKFVLPGLWEMHAHFAQVEWGPVYLAAGVTTARDVGNEFEFITAVRDAVEADRGLGPRLLLAGVVDGESPSALGVVRADTADEARAVVKRYHDAGFRQIKIYSSIKPDVLKVIAAEAHRVGMTVTGHVPEGMNALEAVEAGMDQINHAQYLLPVMPPGDAGAQPGRAAAVDGDSAGARSAIKFFKERGTVFDPTLAIFEMLFHSTDAPASAFEPGLEKIAPELRRGVGAWGSPPAQAARLRPILEQYTRIVGALHRAGIPVVAGTDQTVPGHSLHRELELYVKAGFTPLEAIQAATLVPARVMKLDNESGTVEAGKRADLIITGGDPLQNISNIRRVEWVLANGRLYATAPLWQSVGFKP